MECGGHWSPNARSRFLQTNASRLVSTGMLALVAMYTFAIFGLNDEFEYKSSSYASNEGQRAGWNVSTKTSLVNRYHLPLYAPGHTPMQPTLSGGPCLNLLTCFSSYTYAGFGQVEGAGGGCLDKHRQRRLAPALPTQ
jgi:hypothetical protein